MRGYISEDEARTKWCPMAQSVWSGKRIDNRQVLTKQVAPYNCVASDCMWWLSRTSESDKGYCGGVK